MKTTNTEQQASAEGGIWSRQSSFPLSNIKSRDHHPRQYVTAICNHSNRSQESHLYPGTNYRSLALFLGSWRERGLLAPRNKTAAPPKFDFVTIHDLGQGRDDVNHIRTFDSIDGISAFLSHPLPTNQSGQLVFLRGYPSKEWISAVGARYRINPELFRRQLSFKSSPAAMFDLPGLPSSVTNSIKLPLLSLGKCNLTTCGRGRVEESMQQYWDKLGATPGLVGESIVQQFNAHDDETFSIEQDVTVTVLKRGNGWIAVIFLDVGRDLNDGPNGPWFSSDSQSSLEHIFYPVFQLEPRMFFVNDDDLSLANNPSESPLTTCDINPRNQSASLLSGPLYGRLLDAEIMRLDAFYAMHGLFTFVLSAENQFLNCMRSKMEAYSRRRMADSGSSLHETLQNCIYHRSLLRERIERLRAIEDAVCQRGGPRWPSLKSRMAPPLLVNRSNSGENSSSGDDKSTNIAATGPHCDQALATFQKQMAVVEASDASLQQDCSALLRKAQDLFVLYEEYIEDIRATSSVLEAQRALKQTAMVGRLTFLAFMFIPLSFTTSFFGMNLKELGSGQEVLSIWVWAVVTVLVFAGALTLLYWRNMVSLYDRVRAGKKTKVDKLAV